MLSQVIKNSAMSAKVRAMTGRELTDADYDILMNMKSVPELAAYLIENTAYADSFERILPAELHRGRLERLLRDRLKSDIERLLPFMSRGARRFMEIIAIEDGIERIKVCLRLIHSGHSEQIAEYISEIRGGKAVLQGKLLSELDSVDGLIDLLRKTPYFNALEVFSGRTDRQQPLRIETALDAYWAKLLYKYARKYLSRDEAKTVMKIYGTELDLENLSFLLRCKKTFDMTDEEVYACIVPSYYRLDKETVSKIVKAPSYNDAVSVIESETPYGQAFSRDDRFLEKRRREYTAGVRRRVAAANRYSAAAPICYIMRRRGEINNIVSIIEGIRYGLEPNMIKTYLVGYDRGGYRV